MYKIYYLDGYFDISFKKRTLKEQFYSLEDAIEEAKFGNFSRMLISEEAELIQVVDDLDDLILELPEYFI